MKKLTKKSIMLLVGTMALASVAGVAGAETRFAVQDAAGTTDKMVVTDKGTIGVNVAVPTSGLHIKGSVYPENTVKVEGNEATQGAGFLSYIVRTSGLPLSGDRLGFFLFGTLNGGTPLHAAGIEAKTDGDWTAFSTPSYFSFLTTPSGSTTRTERVRIASNGNVGIGTSLTSGPAQKLEVNGGVRLNTSTTKPACDTNGRGTFWVTKGGVGVKDQVEVCIKDASENYIWQAL